MKKLSLALVATLFFVCQSQSAIVLEFFQGTSVNDTTLSLTPYPNDTVTLVAGGSMQFVQVAMHQTAPTTVLDANNGLAAWLIQGQYGPNQMGNWVVPATVPGGVGTTPVCNVSDPNTYTSIRAYPGSCDSCSGRNETTAFAFRFGGLNLNPPPSPSVDANGRIFLGTFALRSYAGSPGTSNSSIIFQDPHPAAAAIDNITDNSDNLDALLFANGATYPLGITVVPEPTSLVLTSLIVGGAIAMRRRR